MAYFAMHAYDADVWVRQFKGLLQADESLNTDPAYAAEAVNVETPNGVLQPHAAYEVLTGEFTDRVETLAQFTRRWYAGQGSKDWLICAAGGKLYQRQVGDTYGWEQIPFPAGVTEFELNTWSWVNYEVNEINGTPLNNTRDVMLMSNASDGMIMVVPPEDRVTWSDGLLMTWENDNDDTWADELKTIWVTYPVDTRADPTDENEPQKKFGVITRYAERIWGGAVENEPDTLYYSRPYSPTDWSAPGAGEQPEDGAGEVQQPSWDGDSFSALQQFGSQLIAFKKHRVWRVYGTDPGSYAFSEQYGGGAPYPNTIAVDVERILMAEDDGPSAYDGMSVSPFSRAQAKKLWDRANLKAMDQMCAALFKGRYYLSFPIDGSEVNNALLVFDQNENTVLFYDDVTIESLLATSDYLYATSSSLPGKVLKMNYDSWLCGKSSGSHTRWVSAWMDFGYKRIQKGGFDLYILPEVQNEAVTFRVSIQTEKKTKSKYYTALPTVKEHKPKRMHFGGNGRRFRIIIETDEGNKAPWRLVGGLQLVVETDPD